MSVTDLFDIIRSHCPCLRQDPIIDGPGVGIFITLLTVHEVRQIAFGTRGHLTITAVIRSGEKDFIFQLIDGICRDVEDLIDLQTCHAELRESAMDHPDDPMFLMVERFGGARHSPALRREMPTRFTTFCEELKMPDSFLSDIVLANLTSSNASSKELSDFSGWVQHDKWMDARLRQVLEPLVQEFGTIEVSPRVVEGNCVRAVMKSMVGISIINIPLSSDASSLTILDMVSSAEMHLGFFVRKVESIRNINLLISLAGIEATWGHDSIDEILMPCGARLTAVF